MRHRERTFAAVLAVGLSIGLSTSGVAFGQTLDEKKAQARELAVAGFAAMDAQDWAKAEDSFRRADALYHAATLLVGLAQALVHESKFVEAWEAYNRVVVEGPPAGANAAMLEAVETAKKEIDAVAKRRGRVTIQVSGAEHARVSLDGVVLDAAALGAPWPVNPGAHTVHGEADGFAPVDSPFTVDEGGATAVDLKLAPLAPSAPPPAPPPGAPNRVPALAAFGVGGAGLLLGAIAGGVAVGRHSSLKSDPCASGKCADPSAFNSSLSGYHTMTTLSTVGFVVAGVGAATGVVLLFVAPHSREQASTVRVVPYAGLGSGGIMGCF